MTPRPAGWAHQKQPDPNAQTAASFRVVTPLVLAASRKFRATLDAIAIRRHHITHYLNPSSAVSSTTSTLLAPSLSLADLFLTRPSNSEQPSMKRGQGKAAARNFSGAGFGGGFGGFGGAGSGSSLSYLTEPPSFQAIQDPHVVVSLKNILKKDSTTKSKALDELLAHVQAHPHDQDGGVDDAILDVWVCIGFTSQTPAINSR